MNARNASPLGTEIRDRRQQLGLSVRALAARADISPAYVTALETGNNPSTRRPPVPSLAIVRRLADALDLELGALIRAGDAVRPEAGAHVLAYVVAPPPAGLLGAVDAALGADVDHWLHLADPRRTERRRPDPGDDPALRARRVSLRHPAPRPRRADRRARPRSRRTCRRAPPRARRTPDIGLLGRDALPPGRGGRGRARGDLAPARPAHLAAASRQPTRRRRLRLRP